MSNPTDSPVDSTSQSSQAFDAQEIGTLVTLFTANPFAGMLVSQFAQIAHKFEFLRPYTAMLAQNQIFIGGFALLAVFFLIDMFRNNISSIYYSIRKRLYVTVSINESEDAFSLLSEWLMEMLQQVDNSQQGIKRSGRLRSLIGKSVEVDPYQDPYYDNRMDSAENRRPRLVFLPDKGDYSFSYQSHRINVSFVTQSEGGDSKKAPKQQIILSTWSPRGDAGILKDLVAHALKTQYAKDQNKTSLFQAYYDRWRRTTARSPRSFESVILKKGVLEDLLADVENFRASQDWYRAAGVPYRRGYLLWGPPGTGKSSTVTALAGKLGMSICILSLSNGGLTDTSLQELMISTPPGSLVLLEDVDAAFPVEKKKDASVMDTSSSSSSVTLSGLLNCLDGIIAQEGGIVFLTTNHPERLPPALLRPGRCDRRFLFGKADHEQIRRMYVKFFGNDDLDTPTRIADALPEDVLTTAQLQGFFMNYRTHAGSSSSSPLSARREMADSIVSAIPSWLKEIEEEALRFGWNSDAKDGKDYDKESKESGDKDNVNVTSKQDTSIQDDSLSETTGNDTSRTVTPTRLNKKSRRRARAKARQEKESIMQQVSI